VQRRLGAGEHVEEPAEADRPTLITSMPMTTPPGKATERASLNERVAACAVRALAAVAMRMPPNPQSTEQTAPPTNDTAVFQPRPGMLDDVTPP
jgi:hypothetical protein